MAVVVWLYSMLCIKLDRNTNSLEPDQTQSDMDLQCLLHFSVRIFMLLFVSVTSYLYGNVSVVVQQKRSQQILCSGGYDIISTQLLPSSHC